jgi:alpha-galactosidase
MPRAARKIVKERIVLIGAGSAVFTRGLVADLLRTGVEAQVALVDIDSAALEVAERLATKMIAARSAPLTLEASIDRRQVLRDATVVICTIGVGGRRAWEQDVFIPRKHGIYMPVGDTVGPGGSSRAMRMIPAMVAIARDVQELAPRAFFVNYGNPMAPVCRAIYKATGVQVTGLCHGVFHVGQYLADVLNVSEADLRYTAVGINHLTWFLNVRARGQDCMSRLQELAAARLLHIPPADTAEASSLSGTDSPFHTEVPGVDNPFSWQLFNLLGAFPAVLDRHVTEFFPHLFRGGRYYGRVLGVDAFSFEGTIAAGDRSYEEMHEVAFASGPLPADYLERLEGEHEQALDILQAMRRDTGTVFSANLPNTGQVPNLPLDAIVEAPAIATVEGLRHIAQPPLPAALVATLASRYQWVETIVEAALEGSRDKFIQALLVDGAVTSLEQATALADDLLQAQAAYLPWYRPAAETH